MLSLGLSLLTSILTKLVAVLVWPFAHLDWLLAFAVGVGVGVVWATWRRGL